MFRNSKRRPRVPERFLTGVQLCSQTGPVQKSIFHTAVKIYAIMTTTLRHEAQLLIHTQWNGKYFCCLQAELFPWACRSRLGSPTTVETALGGSGKECCGKGTLCPSLISSFRGPASQRTNVRGGAVRDALPAFLGLPRLPASQANCSTSQLWLPLCNSALPISVPTHIWAYVFKTNLLLKRPYFIQWAIFTAHNMDPA